MSSFENVAGELSQITEQGLSTVSKLVNKLVTLQQRQEQLEAEIKEVKANFRTIQEEELPELLAEHNIKVFTMTDGTEINVVKFYSASIPKARAEEAFKWLVENKHGDLIKNQVSTNFVRGQENQAEQFADELTGRGMPVNTRKWVEPMTLKAWAKDTTEKGVDVPQDLFGLYIGQKAVITKK